MQLAVTTCGYHIDSSVYTHTHTHTKEAHINKHWHTTVTNVCMRSHTHKKIDCVCTCCWAQQACKVGLLPTFCISCWYVTIHNMTHKMYWAIKSALFAFNYWLIIIICTDWLNISNIKLEERKYMEVGVFKQSAW